MLPAIAKARRLDHSNRPWENSATGIPDDPLTIIECHPYLNIFGPGGKPLSSLNDGLDRGIAVMPPVMMEAASANRPIIVNEYVWLWLRRNGTPTWATRLRYRRLLGREATEQQRRFLYAMHVASLTEFYRMHPKVLGVHHFCALIYSDRMSWRGFSLAGDNFIGPVAKLELDPWFAKFAGDAFRPLCIFVYRWWDGLERPKAGTEEVVPVMLRNDGSATWLGEVSLAIKQGDIGHDTSRWNTLDQQSRSVQVDPGAVVTIDFKAKLPDKAGEYRMVASYREAGERLGCGLIKS